MHIYFAPLEGITTYPYRNLHHKYFGGVEKYFTPFLAPGPEQGMSVKEMRDVLPENNAGIPVVPQILTFIITVFVCIGAHITNIQYILYWFGAEAAMTFFALALGAFVAMFTGQLLAFPVYYEVFEGEAIRLLNEKQSRR